MLPYRPEIRTLGELSTRVVPCVLSGQCCLLQFFELFLQPTRAVPVVSFRLVFPLSLFSVDFALVFSVFSSLFYWQRCLAGFLVGMYFLSLVFFRSLIPPNPLLALLVYAFFHTLFSSQVPSMQTVPRTRFFSVYSVEFPVSVRLTLLFIFNIPPLYAYRISRFG